LGVFLLALGLKPLQAQEDGWQARYWNNLSLSGTPVLQRTEAEIDHNWGTASPHPIVAEDDFSAEWIQDVELGTGNYRFTATTDDGMRIWVDDVQIIDSWYDSQAHTVNAEMYLPAGSHQIRVAYYDTGGEAVAQVDWVQLTDLQDDWLAQYYNNQILGGAPVHIRNESTIDLNTAGSPVPQVTADNFSVRWTQDVSFDPGSYRFSATAEARLEWSLVGTPPTNPAPGEVTATMTGAFYLNVRSGPGLDFDPFDVLRQDQTVSVIGRDGFAVWLEVVLPSGETGWVSSRYMTSDTPFVDLPITR
jgi:hypothetical protein